MTVTTSRRALDRAELLTTAVAVLVSSTLYATQGAPYLARGVVGDLAGLVLPGGVMARLGRRVRHEALVCLATIGAILTIRPEWPLRQTSAFWWAAVSACLIGHLCVRQVALARHR